MQNTVEGYMDILVFSDSHGNLRNIQKALDAIELGISPDMAGLDVESAIAEFEALDGRRVSEMIVSQIFSGFCVGK